MVRITNNSLSKSSKAWLKEHMEDVYVHRAQKDGYRARAAYKLLEIQEKDRIFHPGMTVVDLGSAPGSWSQVASRLVGPGGRVIASDILPMDALPGVRFIQGDFREEAVLAELLAATEGRPIDLLISDMAPNITGNASADLPRAMHLCDLALDMARQVLKPGGVFVVKVFQGEGFDTFRQAIQQQFGILKSRKPAASRPRSRELYLVAKDFRV